MQRPSNRDAYTKSVKRNLGTEKVKKSSKVTGAGAAAERYSEARIRGTRVARQRVAGAVLQKAQKRGMY
jgi:hypothetical protein